jgi:hypothetical protein
MDAMVVFESWHDSFESPSVIAVTPEDYRVLEQQDHILMTLLTVSSAIMAEYAFLFEPTTKFVK